MKVVLPEPAMPTHTMATGEVDVEVDGAEAPAGAAVSAADMVECDVCGGVWVEGNQALIRSVVTASKVLV